MSAINELVSSVPDHDCERRFGGLRRLYGERDYRRLRGARFAVVGVGGVGSWAVEALARSGVAELVLIDLDQVAESNINRQIQALGSTLGMAKIDALRERIRDIHPDCQVHGIEEFVEPGNWPDLLQGRDIDGLIDACDQVRAKAALAAWARQSGHCFVTVGAAGGKRASHLLEVQDLALSTHDPLLASLRQRLRKEHGLARQGKMGVRCVFSREAVQRPEAACTVDGPMRGLPGGALISNPSGQGSAPVDGSLNCAGYGSSVMVTAAFGMTAAAELVKEFLQSACAD